MNSDRIRYGNLKLELSNSYSRGRDEYPATLSEAHQLLLTYKGPRNDDNNLGTRDRNQRGRGGGRGGGRSERGRGDPGRGGAGRGEQSGGTTAGRDNNTDGSGRGGRNFAQFATSLAEVHDHFPNRIPDNLVLLDSDSTISIFKSKEYLTNIRDAEKPLQLHTNGGDQISEKIGTLAGIGDVWYNPNSMANILSLAQVRRVRRVTLDTAEWPAFYVHCPDGGYTVFYEHESGLYLHDIYRGSDNSSSPSDIAYSHLQTVENNKKKYTVRQVELADEARKLHHLLGRPGTERLIKALNENQIINCHITSDDVKRAEEIYGKDVAFLKGKTTASPPKDHLPDYTPVTLPTDLLAKHRDVTLCFDIFYILGMAFSISTSRNIQYISCQAMKDQNKLTMKKCIEADVRMYQERGFQVMNIHADGEFHTMRTSFPNIHFSTCSADDHVPEVERAIRTIKQTVQATIHGMPFKRLPRAMVRELLFFSMKSNNSFPATDGVSTTLSPDSIVSGRPKPDYRNMKLEFGTYVQVYDGTSNDTKSRTLGAIALNATGNANGDYFFMSLATGQKLHRRSWVVLPISDLVISRVEAIAVEEEMPTVDQPNTITEYDPDKTVDDSAYDKDYQPSAQPPPQEDHILTSDAYTSTEADTKDESDGDSDDDGHRAEFDDEPDTVEPTNKPPNKDVDPRDVNDPECDLHRPIHRTVIFNHTAESTDEEEKLEEEERVELSPDEEEERKQTNRVKDKGLRPQRKPNYSYHFGFMQTDSPCNGLPDGTTWEDAQLVILSTPIPLESERNVNANEHLRKAIFGLAFTQMSAAKGIKKYGQAAWDALKKEFLQFKHLDVLEPLDAFTMTKQQKAEALTAISVIKEKRNGTLKGRTVADGRPQRGKYSKAETASPTMSNDALFMSIMIDMFENRDVATANISGAYLHAYMKDFVCLRFTGWAVDLLCEVNPEYEKYVVYKGKTKALYLHCDKAIYGCVVSCMLWYELFVSVLEKEGFQLNPYDFCVANAKINGKQCTVGWYVDDTKISHVQSTIVDRILLLLEHHFGKLTITQGWEHDFLGMHIMYKGDGTASIHMPSYIQEAIEESNLTITNNAPTPCANSLFDIDTNSPALDRTRAATFHSIVAKLIYVGTRARSNILLALAFLCGRVSQPTKQDEWKLQQLLEYLRGTIDMPLIIGADSLASFFTWVDASFATHTDMRSHTGGVISFGRGGIICKSSKQ